jgi:UDP-glucose 4,6-dehydratase
MKILVTGGLGFIGSTMVRSLRGHNVVVLDKVDDHCSSFKNINLEEVTFVKGNICNHELVNLLLSTHKIEVIIHFAAETHVDKSFGNSLLFTESNVLGTHTLLECTRLYGKVKKFIHVSTDEVYGEASHHKNISSVESDTLYPTNPYAATKAAAEHIALSYHISFGLPVIVTRSNNVFGTHQYPEKLIPRFIVLLGQDKPCSIHGTGENKRSYLHVNDVCSAISLIVEKGTSGKIYNIGSLEEYRNLDIWRELVTIFRSRNLLTHEDDNYYLEYIEDRDFNDRRYWIDSSEIEKLGWTRKHTNFRGELEKVVDWYLTNHPGNHWPNYK